MDSQGKLSYSAGKYEEARKYFQQAMNCTDYIYKCIDVQALINNCDYQMDLSQKKKDRDNRNIIQDIFTDSRDKHVYKWVKIGTQTWMAENLAYKADRGCWAYNNKKSNVKTYGYLYNWETAKKVCPSGWHLPTDTEWTTMIN